MVPTHTYTNTLSHFTSTLASRTHLGYLVQKLILILVIAMETHL